MSEPVRFIHTADIHLGHAFKGLSASSQTVGAKLVDAVMQSFRTVVRTAIDERVDFMVIAGDTFDSANVSYATYCEFVSCMKELGGEDIAVYLITGNHDPLVGWGDRAEELPANVHLFATDEPQRIEHTRNGEVVCALYGQSYARESEGRNLVAGIRRQPGDALAVGVMHTTVTADDSYAPCSVGDLVASGMDYWALGHIHRREEVCADPLALQPGSPQGLNINENTEHGCYLVTLQPGVTARADFVATASIAWEKLELKIGQLKSIELLRSYLIENANELMSRHQGRPVCARITLRGRGDLHEKLRTPGLLDTLRSDLYEQLNFGTAWFWVDAIFDETEPEIDERQLREGGMFASAFLDIAEAYEKAAGELAATGGQPGASASASATAADFKKRVDTVRLGEELANDVWKLAKVSLPEGRVPVDELAARAKTRALDALLGGESS